MNVLYSDRKKEDEVAKSDWNCDLLIKYIKYIQSKFVCFFILLLIGLNAHQDKTAPASVWIPETEMEAVSTNYLHVSIFQRR